MPKRRKLNNLETCNLKLETQGERKEKEIASAASRLRNNGNEKLNREKKARSKRNYQKDRLEILIVDGKMTVQDYSEEHDSEKLIEMLKAMGIKPKIESDGPCG